MLTASKIKMKTLRLPLITLVLLSGLAAAQELEPRAYSNAPVGMNFVGAIYGISRGNVIVDASLPVEDFRVTAHNLGAVYVRALNFFGKHGKVRAQAPFVWLSGDLKVAGRDTSGARTGFADARVSLSVNFIGAPALSSREFRNYQQKTVAGASLIISIPIDWPVLRGQIRQPRGKSLGLQTGGRLATGWQVVSGGLWWGLAVHGQYQISAHLNAGAEAAFYRAGPPELCVQTRAVAGGEWRVRRRRGDFGEWQFQEQFSKELAHWRYLFAAIRTPARLESATPHRRGNPGGIGF